MEGKTCCVTGMLGGYTTDYGICDKLSSLTAIKYCSLRFVYRLTFLHHLI